jgi:hypothetical protein
MQQHINNTPKQNLANLLKLIADTEEVLLETYNPITREYLKAELARLDRELTRFYVR